MQAYLAKPLDQPGAYTIAYDGASDQELIAGVCRRDEPALGAIYDRYHRLVFAIALRITGEQTCAEEVVQDVFHAVWRSAGSFQAGASLAAWLVGIARHRAIDVTRAQSFRARAREAVLDDAGLGAHGSATDGYVAGLLQRQVVHAALGKISPVQREAIELAYYGGLTESEIAARLGIPLGTVKSRMRGGLLRLRELLRARESS